MIKQLEICAEIEETVSRVYFCLAEQLPPGSELRLIWEEMARDEQEHARLLQFAQRFDPDKTYAGYHIAEDEACRLLVGVQETFDLVRMKTLSEREAVMALLKLEEDFMRVHLRLAVECLDPTMQETFNRLGKADETHVARLKEYSLRS